MKKRVLLIEGINPEPWTAPSASVGRGKGGKVYPVLTKGGYQEGYQEALKEIITAAYPSLMMFPNDMELEVKFFFWRQLDVYKSVATGRSAQRKVADATNMQKSTEDALQKILFKNDNMVKRITSEVVASSEETQGQILIIVGEYVKTDYAESVASAIKIHRAEWPHSMCFSGEIG